MLKPREKGPKGPLGRFFAWFNRGFARATDGLCQYFRHLVHKSGLSLLLLLGFAGGVVAFG